MVEDIASIFRVLCQAVDADMKSSRSDDYKVANVVNACLVLAGVRCGARLEYHTKDSRFMQELANIGARREHPCVAVCPHVCEPLIVDVAKSQASDIGILEERFGVESDMVEPLVSAMGRLLGYKCEYPKAGQHDDTNKMINFRALLQIGFEKPITLWLAGFGCGKSISNEKMGALRQEMQLTWSDPANIALLGCEAEIWGTTCKILGFWIE